MILKIKHKNGFYVNREFLSFDVNGNTVDVVNFSAHSLNPTDTIKDWEAIYILNPRGETIDTIRNQ